MTEDSDMERNRINRINHNLRTVEDDNNSNNDSEDEEFAILQCQRRQRVPCLDYEEYLMP